MKVKITDFGYNLDAIQDPEQKKFMESILGAMADVINKATEGMLTQKDVDTQFNGINDKLNFQGVFLFLTRIIPALFFLGRSISHSVASTSTVSKCASWGNRRLVGKFNCPLCISVFSTHRMLSQIVLLATA